LIYPARYLFRNFLFILFIIHASAAQPSVSIAADRRLSVNGSVTPYYVKNFYYHNDSVLLSLLTGGLLFLDNSGSYLIAEGFPRSPATGQYRDIQDMCHLHGKMDSEFFFATASEIFLYNKVSKAIKNHSIEGIRGGSRISSIAVHEYGDNKKSFFLGTTFNGIYYKTNTTYSAINFGLPREIYSWNEYFYYEIKKIFVVNNLVCCIVDRHPGFYFYNGSEWKTHSIDFFFDGFFRKGSECFLYNTNALYVLENPGAGVLRIKEIKKNPPAQPLINLQGIILHHNPQRPPYPKKKEFPGVLHTNIISVFVNLDFVTFSQMDIVVDLLRRKLINGVVINFKDDTGNLIYGSRLPEAVKYKSGMVHPKLHTFLKKIKPHSPYVIARLVVFKDYRLHMYNNGQYAIWDKEKNTPWRINKIEYWVDPYSTETVAYNVAVAKELQDRKDEFMIKELQFDYIRLPSDRSLYRADFRFKKPDWQRIDILEFFLYTLNSKISIPYSVDIYGYNAIYRMGNVIGQDIETISKYAPVICPMFYPSHFGRVYLANRNNKPQEFNVFEFGVSQANRITFSGTIIRPYLQAFSYRVPQYDHIYILNQINGALEGGSSGISFWNPSGNYTKLDEFFAEIVKKLDFSKLFEKN